MFVKYAVGVLTAALLAAGSASSADDRKPPEIKIEDFQKLPADAKAVLDAAEQVELYSLDPAGGQLKKADAGFHGWKVLGKTVLKEADTRKKVRAAVYKGIAENFGVAGCFHPRHGLRATHKGKTVDLVICFECAWMSVVVKEKGVKDKESVVWTAATPQPVLDRVLRDAGVPLPRPAGDD